MALVRQVLHVDVVASPDGINRYVWREASKTASCELESDIDPEAWYEVAPGDFVRGSHLEQFRREIEIGGFENAVKNFPPHKIFSPSTSSTIQPPPLDERRALKKITIHARDCRPG